MKLLSLTDAPTPQQAMFFRASPLKNMIGFLISLAMLAAVVYGYGAGELPFWIALAGGLFLLLFVWMFLNMLCKSFLPTNWLLAVGPDRLWIKYRSYLNCRFPDEDLQIVELLFSEIASVTPIRRKERTTGSRNRTQTAFYRLLELTLLEPLGDALTDGLRAERNKKASIKSCDYPVFPNGANALRVRMNGIRPNWKKATAALAMNGIAVAPEKREVEDFTQPLKDKQQMDEQILRLAEQGSTFAAVKLARQRYGMGLTEAKQFVEELSGR